MPLESHPTETGASTEREERLAPSTRKSSAQLGFFLPSVADLLFIILLFGLCYGAMASRLLNDAGIGWHIRNGELMLRTHAVTRTDPFSSAMAGKPWYAWEWLFDVAAGALNQWLGLNGVVFFAALLIALSFALTLRAGLRRGGGLPVTVLLLMLALGAASIHFFARPHLFTWLFAVIWFEILDRYELHPEESRALWWLPLLMLLWANLHGGFLAGFALLGIYILSAGIRRVASRNRLERALENARLKRLGIIGLLAMAASLVNPYGAQLYVHIYRYLSNRFLMDHIEEFRSPNFHGLPQQCFAGLLLIALIGLAAAPKKVRFSQLVMVLFAAYLGLYAARNLPLSSLWLVLVLAPMLSESMSRAADGAGVAPAVRRWLERSQSFAIRMGRMEANSRGHLWPAAAAVLTLAVCIHGGRIGSNQVIDAHFSETRFPVRAAGVIAQRGLHEPIFCPDYWGGYLIYRFYPKPVVLDDRHDLYGEAFFTQYLKTVAAEPGWDTLLKNQNVNWVLMPAGSPLANILKEAPQWSEVYKDDVAELFGRGSQPAQ